MRRIPSSIQSKLRGYTIRTLPVLSLLLLASVPVNPYPQDYFRSPLGIPITLAGSFAEMRSNHFHSGLDIKTNGKSGYRVYATAEGWISRIVVSPSGFGNALYVTHPNGYVTVYAHLDRFSKNVAEYVRRKQNERESFSTDLFPSRDLFKFMQGDVIAYSGNSGSSSGPPSRTKYACTRDRSRLNRAGNSTSTASTELSDEINPSGGNGVWHPTRG